MPWRKNTEFRSNNREMVYERKLKAISVLGSTKNRKLVLEYVKMRAANGLKPTTVYSELITHSHLLKFAGKRPFKKLTRQDIATFLTGVRESKFHSMIYKKKFPHRKFLPPNTLELHKLITRQFMTYIHGCKSGEYPECVRWMVIKRISGNRKIEPKDLLTPEEIKRMISCTENPRDRLLISLLAESGARAGELSMLRIRDVNFSQDREGFTLTLDGKTGERTIPLCLCEVDLKDWLNNYHPFKSDPDAPLFTSFANRSIKTNLQGDGVYGVVMQVGRRAGINKKVHPHLFRHTRATELARLGWNEVMLRQFFGWDKRSDMPAVYIHLAQHDLQDYYLRMYGKKHPRGKRETKVLQEAGLCSACGARNPTGYIYCFNCNQPLSERTERRTEADGILNFIVQRSDLREKLDELLKAAVKAKSTSTESE